MNNLLIAIAVFTITVVGALFAVPHFIDWNSYRSIFEDEAKNVIGRDVQVDGDVKLYLLPTPYFSLGKVRIADASANQTGHFFKAESLSIKLSITPLFRGTVEAHEIEFQSPFLRVAVDANGRWNWQGFAQALRSAGYVPASVALTAVRIRDGVLALHGPDGVERARLEKLNGVLSAPALDGPYRFRGDFTLGGVKREIRLATVAPEPDGKLPFRLSLLLPDTGWSYSLDGRAIDLMGKTRMEGDLTVRRQIAGRSLQEGAAGGREEEPKLDLQAEFELRAKVKADAAGAKLWDLALTLEHGGRPQVIGGSAAVSWASGLAFEMRLDSTWLDLDRIVGRAEGSAPIDSLGRFAAWAGDLLPADSRVRASIAIEQATLGGEAIGSVRLTVARSANKLEIEELHAGLPGGSRGELTGSLSGHADTLAFTGRLGLRGTSAARLLAWATGNKLNLGTKGDGAFELRAHLTLDSAEAAARDLVGSLAGTMLAGSVRYKWAGRPELTVHLEGPKIDARGLVPTGLSLLDAFDMLANAPFAKQAEARVPAAARADLDLRVKAGQVITGARTYRDVSAVVELKGGSLKQLKLHVAGDDGYNLELEGNVEGLGGLQKGSLRGFVIAETAAGVTPLAELLGIPAEFRPRDGREQAIVPLRLAGTLTFGSRTATSADLVVDGEADSAAVKVVARLDGGAGGWRHGRADVTASIEAGDAAKVASLLFPAGMTPGRGSKPGRIVLRAAGVPSSGLTSLAVVDAGDVWLNFRGQIVVAEAGGKVQGDLEVRAGNATLLAALAGLAPLRADGVPVSARLKLAVDGSAMSFDKLTLQVGSSRVSGQVTVSAVAGRRRIEANLNTDEISVARLLGPLLDQRFAAAGAAEAILHGRQTPWPDEPFNASILDAFEGQIRLSVKRLTLADGVALDRAKLSVVLQPGKVEIKEIAGAGLGGQFKAALSIGKASAGVDVRGTLDFGIALEAFAGGSPPRASGTMNGTIAFAGRGLTPRAVVSALQGEGSITFGEAKLTALWPGAIAAAADAALKAESGKLASAMRQSLAAGLGAGSLPLQQKTLALEIADGQLRSKSFLVDTSDGSTSGTAHLDLRVLTLDSQWRLEAKAPGAGTAAKPLPAVTIAYRGPITALGAIEPQIDATSLEQELSERKIAQGMAELERLRLEEQRRLNDADGLRKPPEQIPPPQRLPPGRELRAPQTPG